MKKVRGPESNAKIKRIAETARSLNERVREGS
jgi:hypothetical protein